MSKFDPTSDFAAARLNVEIIRPGQIFGHLYPAKYPNPLGYGKTPSRFSDPRRLIEANRFGILYLGQTLSVCFVEAILRDRRNGAIGDYLISEAEINASNYALIEPERQLTLVDLRGNGCVRMGIPSDVPRRSNQALARRWSLAIYEHPSTPDGIIYPSRLNGETNLAVFDRAVSKLRVKSSLPLIRAAGFADALDTFQVSLVP